MTLTENECWLIFGLSFVVGIITVTYLISRTVLVLDGKFKTTIKIPKATLISED